MSIIRRHKTENYSVISNHCIRNKSLSAKAKGIFCYIMTLPDDWKLYRTELTGHFSDGKDSIRSGFDELIEAGYIKATQLRDETGKLSGWEYDIHEYPPADLPIAENPPSGNPPLLNTKRQLNTKETNISIREDFDESPAEKSSLPHPEKAAAPSPAKKPQNGAVEAEVRLIEVMSRSLGIKLTSKPTGAGISRLLKAGVSIEEVNEAISWLGENATGKYTPVVQSGGSLYEKWGKVKLAMSRQRSENAPAKERVVLSKGDIHFVDRPKCGDNYMRETFKEEHRAKYRVLTPDQYRSEK